MIAAGVTGIRSYREAGRLKRESFVYPLLQPVVQLNIVASIGLVPSAPVYAAHLHFEMVVVHTDDQKVMGIRCWIHPRLDQMFQPNVTGGVRS
jgi:hypothetical protein